MESLSDDEKKCLEGAAPLLAAALPSLLRKYPPTLDSYFKTIELNVELSELKGEIRCHFLAVSLDGNNRPRIKDLAVLLRDRVLEYSIPVSRIEQARRVLEETGSPAIFSKLNEEAKKLFANVKNTGEGGEVLLYILAQFYLGLPQLLCKMPLKTNSQVHYHGVDGIHGKVDENTQKLALYWGESKLYQDMNSAISSCFSSLAPFLKSDGGSVAPCERDLQLIRANVDFNDQEMEDAFKLFLDKDNPNFNLLEYRGMCLIGFDSDAYPDTANEKEMQFVLRDLEVTLNNFKVKVAEALKSQKIDTFAIEVFCVPFPEVQAFRDAFLKEIG